MSVIKDMGLKEPYVGQIALQTGEIAEDPVSYTHLPDNAELLYHGKEHEQRRCADGECDRDDNVISGIYADRRCV